jgi:predicted RNA-binding Zn-ribbon protein involved in translation (DUF1610 family)
MSIFRVGVLNRTKAVLRIQTFVIIRERRMDSTMKYAMCPNCGRRLCKGEPGTTVEIECPKCGEMAIVII